MEHASSSAVQKTKKWGHKLNGDSRENGALVETRAYNRVQIRTLPSRVARNPPSRTVTYLSRAFRVQFVACASRIPAPTTSKAPAKKMVIPFQPTISL